jgi:hypothetical protein
MDFPDRIPFNLLCPGLTWPSRLRQRLLPNAYTIDVLPVIA